jgi:drug/metabolite transporter (DMT)-like permease
MKSRNNGLAVILVLIGALSYGLVSSVFKLGVEAGWSVTYLTFQQVVSGTVMLWLFAGIARLRKRGEPGALNGSSLVRLAIIGVVGLSFTTIFFNESVARLDASLTIVLLFQYTWITILLDSLLRRRWPKRSEWAAIGFVMAGTVLAAGLLEHDIGGWDRIGVLFGLLSGVSYGLYFLLTGYVTTKIDPISKSAIMSTASFIFIVLLRGTEGFKAFGHLELAGWGILLGILGTVLPFICFNFGIPKLGSGAAALLGSMELPAAIVAAYFLLGEPLSWGQAVGVALILAGVVISQRKSGNDVVSGKDGEI